MMRIFFSVSAHDDAIVITMMITSLSADNEKKITVVDFWRGSQLWNFFMASSSGYKDAKKDACKKAASLNAELICVEMQIKQSICDNDE